MSKKVIIYDSDCAFCSWCVLFVLRFDTKQRYVFAALNSEYAQAFFTKNRIVNQEMIWLVVGEQYYAQSGAVIRIIAGMRWFFSPVILGLVVPPFIRNWCYTFISKRRHKIIKNNVCPVLPTEDTGRFLA